ncbi:MAG: hypothetical protein HQM08_02245 [Candidatus Riflebacteria bacterium]|nr:hypothetical protein [Candidatus Riflebacteria bacterium]
MKPVSNKFHNKFLCPCCHLPTLSELESYEICRICNWEDDGQDDENEEEVWGGPNGRYSLREARYNFYANQTMYALTDLRMFNQTRMNLPWKRATIILLKKAMETNLESDWELSQKLFNEKLSGRNFIDQYDIHELSGAKFKSIAYSEAEKFWVLNLSNSKVQFSSPFRFFRGDHLILSSNDFHYENSRPLIDLFSAELSNSEILDAYFHERIGDFCITFTPFKILQVWPICPEVVSWKISFNSQREIIFGPGEKNFALWRAKKND